MKDTRGIDTDEVEQDSTKKVEKDETNIHSSVSTDSLRITQNAGSRVGHVYIKCCILNGTACPVM